MLINADETDEWDLKYGCDIHYQDNDDDDDHGNNHDMWSVLFQMTHQQVSHDDHRIKIITASIIM